MKYLNNIMPSANNTGNGVRRSDNKVGQGIAEAAALQRLGSKARDNPNFGKINESWDVTPNVIAAEANECGTWAGDFGTNIVGGMTPQEKALVADGLRLPTGDLHQCPCALAGRAHIINGTVADVYNWSSVADSWGLDYTTRAKKQVERQMEQFKMFSSKEELANVNFNAIFGIHSIYCPYRASGPCKLHDVERGVAAAWARNFSQGYVPLMDNNALYWTATIGPLLDALLRDGVDFYPMVWTAPASESGPRQDIYSVLVSPCGKQLVEVAAPESGGRSRDLFHEMAIPRAVFEHWNKPQDPVTQPLVPLRISRAVPPARLDAMLDFYGVGQARRADAAALGFGQARILADVTDSSGSRAVTVMLSPLATVHLQLWARPDSEPEGGPAFPTRADFEAAAGSNQVSGGQPRSAEAFCSAGAWSVGRYTEYLFGVHETVMTPVPDADSNGLTPPVGAIMDVFLDDHISWDCTAPQCDMVAGGRALYNFGSRIQWVNTGGLGGNWTPYSYDPAGYGVQLHWYYASEGFSPQGPVYPECFDAHRSNSTCPNASPLNSQYI